MWIHNSAMILMMQSLPVSSDSPCLQNGTTPPLDLWTHILPRMSKPTSRGNQATTLHKAPPPLPTAPLSAQPQCRTKLLGAPPTLTLALLLETTGLRVVATTIQTGRTKTTTNPKMAAPTTAMITDPTSRKDKTKVLIAILLHGAQIGNTSRTVPTSQMTNNTNQVNNNLWRTSIKMTSTILTSP
jgi:hypothetical protein